jgi:hypothetical protein
MKKRKVKATFDFGDGCRTYSGAAVYKISFSAGNNYIGKAVFLKNRITSHVTDSFYGFPKSASLRKMIKYEGVIRFEIIEFVENGNLPLLRERELFHIQNHPGFDKRLNYQNGLSRKGNKIPGVI